MNSQGFVIFPLILCVTSTRYSASSQLVSRRHHMPKVRRKGKHMPDVQQAPEAVRTIEVALVAQADEDLTEAMRLTGLSKTDVTNRAISLYRFVEAELRSGGELLLRTSQGSFKVKLM